MKTNIRSFRYSDEVAGKLQGFSGNSLNEKFENLVNFCFLELPKIHKQKSDYEKDISKLRAERKKLCDEIMALTDVKNDMKAVIRSMDALVARIDRSCNT